MHLDADGDEPSDVPPVKEKSRCALTKCHLGRWDKGRMRTCQENARRDFSEVFNAGGRFEKMHFFFAQLFQGVIQRKKLVRSMVFTDLTRF